MTEKQAATAIRKPRADASRNRERILEAAKAGFSRFGVDVSLDEVARQAGVGPGSLYRHFPTRQALLTEVYRVEVERLAAAERKFAKSMSPIDALQAWMMLFVDYIATKKIIAPALNSLVQEHRKVVESSGAEVIAAITALVRRAIEAGDVRADLEPLDILRALIGVSNVASAPDWQKSAKRLVEILVAGSRP